MTTDTVEFEEGDLLSEGEFRERLRELPPSSKLVAWVLRTDGPLAQGEIAEETLLPKRTVRFGLRRLEEANLIRGRYSFKDPCKRLYAVTAKT